MSAFGAIVQAYEGRVLGLALRTLGDPALAREASQEAFVRLHRALHRLDPERPLFTYLYRVVINVCRDLAARERRRQGEPLTAEEERQVHDLSDPVREVEKAELLAVVKGLAQRLGVQQRAAFVLRDIEGLEIADIARILRCRQSTVRSHLCLARRALCALIEKEFPELLEGR